MNKLKFIKYLLVVLIFVSVGCNDLLEEPSPATSTSPEIVLTTSEGIATLRNSFYNRMRASFNYSTEYMIGPSAFADETRNRPGSTRFQGLNEATGTDGDTNGLSSYGTAYSMILDANLMLNSIDGSVLDQATLDRYQGEAYAFRAFAMHHLVRALGYEPGMAPTSGPGAGWEQGIPIITEPVQSQEDVVTVPRSTVSDVYNQILSDLGEAKTRLAGTNSNTTRITEAFVDGMIARVNLYAGNWGAANDAAADAITNSGIALSNTESQIANMFDETSANHPEAMFKVVVNPNTEPIAGSNVNNGLAAYTAEQWSAQLPTNRVLDSYEADDYRLGWYEECFDTFNVASESDCADVNDEGYELQKFNGEKGNLADDIPYMRVAEMYLIQAEAAAKDANNVAAGIGPLNDLRDARNASQVLVTDFASLEEFEDFILEERVRELVSEGHRFWDLKRLGRNIPNPNGTDKMRYDSYRILDNIGAGNISSNPELVENPGY
ncbi:MAG: RagB/SusD family nutrient uptake outer membrane protein [Candidatus Halalkalibacterium sp. M3_1C_030]